MIKAKKLAALGLIVTLVMGFTGCELPSAASDAINKVKDTFQKEEAVSDTEVVENGVFRVGSKTCPEGEAKVLLLEYQQQYSTLYGIDMWDHDYGDGISLEDYIKDLSISQLAMVYTLDIVAESEGIELDAGEKSDAIAAAKEYYAGLSKAEKAYIDISEEAVASLMRKYALAYKIYDTVQAGIDNEVSDSEARVASVLQIYTTDKNKALSYKEQLDGGKVFTDINSAANEKSVDCIYVNRDTFPSNVVEAIFDLDFGEYSDILEADDGYYIFCCVNPFEKDMTDEHKADVLANRTQNAMSSIYAKYKESLDSEIIKNNWNRVKVDTELELSQTSFTTCYQQYFGE